MHCKHTRPPRLEQDLASENPAKLREMLTKLNTKNLGFFNPDRGTSDPKACDQANTNGNFWGELPCKLAPSSAFC